MSWLTKAQLGTFSSGDVILQPSGDRVGIGTRTPGAGVHITFAYHSINSLWVENTSTIGFGPYIRGGNDNSFYSLRVDSQPGSALFQICGNGNIGINTTTQFGGGTGVVGLLNATRVPTGSPANAGILYAESGALKWRGSSGTITIIAPA